MLGTATRNMLSLMMNCTLSLMASATPGTYSIPNSEIFRLIICRNGWGASAVDAFSTACVMQLPDIVNTILDYIPTIDFDHTSDGVSLFETTIRYLGGMLSGKKKKLCLTADAHSHRLRLPERASVKFGKECYGSG
jgi:Glycosyl hydrolase family 47